MPWCADCEHFLAPSTVNADGSCPTCGKQVEPGGARVRAISRVPWHLRLLLAVFAVYIGFRLVQGVDWLVGKI